MRAVKAGADTRAAIERKVRAGKAAVDRALAALERSGVLTATKVRPLVRVTKAKAKPRAKARAKRARQRRASLKAGPYAPGAVREFANPREATPKIEIRYYAIPNQRAGGGFLPQYDENGRARLSTYSSLGWDRDVALKEARREAEEHAARFVGDWDVTVAEKKGTKRNPAPVMSAKEGRAFKAQVAQSNARTLRALARDKVKELRLRVKEARARGPLRTKEVRALVKRTRELVLLGAKAASAADVLRAKRELEVERTDQATQTRLEKANRAAARSHPGVSKAVKRSESDGEVEGNLPPEFVPLWHKVKRSIKSSERRSRTESFLEYVAEHPGEVIDAQEGGVDKEIAKLEARANAAHDFARKRSYGASDYDAPPF